MSMTVRSHKKRLGERRAADRRQADMPFAGKDRRRAQRRSGGDRRA